MITAVYKCINMLSAVNDNEKSELLIGAISIYIIMNHEIGRLLERLLSSDFHGRIINVLRHVNTR